MLSFKQWLLTAALFLFSVGGCVAGTDAIHVQTANGTIQGQSVEGGARFLGIPYAKPPIGALRWAPPEPATKWSGTFDATKLGDACTQLTLAPPRPKDGSEDCLNLNIYVPARHLRDKPLPVMVWFHGGSFLVGAAQDADGQVLADKAHIIVITVNYRLGVFGFFASPALDAVSPDGVSGNQGIRDQQLALRWVRDNIPAFGGDPAQVTLSGQSAGAMSNWIHMASPQSAGLFHRAMGDSYPPVTRNYSGGSWRGGTGGYASLRDEETRGPSSRLLAALGCADAADKLECARSKDTDAVLYAMDKEKLLGSGWRVVYDGKLLPDSIETVFKQSAYQKVPMLAGFNYHDDPFRIQMTIANGGKLVTPEQYAVETRALPHGEAVLTEYPVSAYSSAEDAKTALKNDSSACSAFDSAKELSKSETIYLFEFADPNALSTEYEVDVPAGVHKDSFHTSELTYFFQSGVPFAKHSGKPPFSPSQKSLSDRMVQYWGGFVRDGRPTKNAAWPAMSPKGGIYILTPEGDAVMSEPQFSLRHRCAFWRTVGS